MVVAVNGNWKLPTGRKIVALHGRSACNRCALSQFLVKRKVHQMANLTKDVSTGSKKYKKIRHRPRRTDALLALIITYFFLLLPHHIYVHRPMKSTSAGITLCHRYE